MKKCLAAVMVILLAAAGMPGCGTGSAPSSEVGCVVESATQVDSSSGMRDEEGSGVHSTEKPDISSAAGSKTYQPQASPHSSAAASQSQEPAATKAPAAEQPAAMTPAPTSAPTPQPTQEPVPAGLSEAEVQAIVSSAQVYAQGQGWAVQGSQGDLANAYVQTYTDGLSYDTVLSLVRQNVDMCTEAVLDEAGRLGLGELSLSEIGATMAIVYSANTTGGYDIVCWH